MNEFIEQSIIELYDEHVQAVGADGGVKVAETRAAIRDEVRVLVATTERDIDQETDALLGSVISTTRSRRSRSMKASLAHFFDGTISEDGAYIDPLLDMAFGLGDEHGVDKCLRHWTVEDFDQLVVTRYRVAADATESAKNLDDAVQQMKRTMRAAGALTVGGVDWQGRQAAAS